MTTEFLIKNSFSSSDTIKKAVNPYTNEEIGEYFSANETHFCESADYLTKIQKKYSLLPAYKRVELLYYIEQSVSKKKDELAYLITLETGKPIKFSRIEVERATLTFRLGAEEASRISGEVLNLDLLKGSENKIGIVRRFPVGLILGITPWNFPVNLAAHKISPALASGNTILLKPSSNSMLCGIELGKIIFESCEAVGLDFCPINVLSISGNDLDKHVSDERNKMLSFTGSSDIGWNLKSKAVKQKVSLELGGNAGVIVESDADIESATGGAVAKITLGGFSQAGQSCISVQRVFVNEKIYDDFRNRLIEETKKIKFGNPFDEETICGPMITEDEAIRAEKWIAEAKQSGANILTGGGRNKAVLEPAVIENASDSAKVNCEEVFAPVITIQKYTSFEDAVNKINDSRFGLQAAVFTNDLKKILFAYNNIRTGGVIINEASAYRMDSMPYGGVKDSGNTREGVAYAIKEMTEEKILVL